MGSTHVVDSESPCLGAGTHCTAAGVCPAQAIAGHRTGTRCEQWVAYKHGLWDGSLLQQDAAAGLLLQQHCFRAAPLQSAGFAAVRRGLGQATWKGVNTGGREGAGQQGRGYW
jgi:hypothetical protein